MTIIRIIRIRLRVLRVAIRGRGLVEEIRYQHHYGVCKTFVVAAAATVYQKGFNAKTYQKCKEFLAFTSLEVRFLQRMI